VLLTILMSSAILFQQDSLKTTDFLFRPFLKL